jgi:hypothetical protein
VAGYVGALLKGGVSSVSSLRKAIRKGPIPGATQCDQQQAPVAFRSTRMLVCHETCTHDLARSFGAGR